MSECTTLRFKIYSRDYDKLKKYANNAGVSPQAQAKVWVQRRVAMLPDKPEEPEPDFKLEHLKSALEHWGFKYNEINKDKNSNYEFYDSKILDRILIVFESDNKVYLSWETGRDLIPNYHSFSHILRRRINLLVSHHTIRPQYLS